MARHYAIVDDFAPETTALRAHFDERFAEPRVARGDRFVWDMWHVPGQYTALRTPAWTYFPKRLYAALHARLVAYGRSELGCHDISPPWLSCYIEGCKQELHGDLPHGPFAFVLSLTPWRGRAFRGGETLLLRPDILDYWRGFASVRGLEEPGILHALAPRFGRLVVFDPRVPHGVREVRGTMDPREGRLVLHGWFVQPRPFIEGPVSTKAVAARIASLTDTVSRQMEGGLDVAGVLSLRARIGPDGRVNEARVLRDTTRVPAEQEGARRRLVRAVRAALLAMQMPRARGPSTLTLPLVFERG
ncbi:MAG: 2OG-Fe(II) oxygenase [Myxococcales bacterium]|nr:2OG-Fe(II) oxygenase [Myxococcales bacterium]